MHDGWDQDHRPTDVARVTSEGLLSYDGGQEALADLIGRERDHPRPV